MPVEVDSEEWRLAHNLLYAVKDVMPDKRGRYEAWHDAIAEVRRLQRLLDEKHERNKVLEATVAGQATPLRPR